MKYLENKHIFCLFFFNGNSLFSFYKYIRLNPEGVTMK